MELILEKPIADEGDALRGGSKKNDNIKITDALESLIIVPELVLDLRSFSLVNSLSLLSILHFICLGNFRYCFISSLFAQEAIVVHTWK